MRFVVRKDGLYLTNRRGTGRMYESRATLSVLANAKVFNTKAAAINSANHTFKSQDYEVLECEIRVVEEGK